MNATAARSQGRQGDRMSEFDEHRTNFT